jgi:hypothetical protein
MTKENEQEQATTKKEFKTVDLSQEETQTENQQPKTIDDIKDDRTTLEHKEAMGSITLLEKEKLQQMRIQEREGQTDTQRDEVVRKQQAQQSNIAE